MKGFIVRKVETEDRAGDGISWSDRTVTRTRCSVRCLARVPVVTTHMMSSPGARHQDVPRPRLPQVSHTLPGSRQITGHQITSVTSSIFCLVRFPVYCYPFNRENNASDGSWISGNAKVFIDFLENNDTRMLFWENTEKTLHVMN